MKQFLFALAVMGSTVVSMPTAFAASNSTKSTCKVETNDIGTIIGRGRNPAAAFEDAATQCFDRRAQLFEMKKGRAADEDTSLTFIDLCANVKCES